MFRSLFCSRGQTFELVPFGPGLRPTMPGERVPADEAAGILAPALASPSDRLALRRAADLLGPGDPTLEDDALLARLLAALTRGRLLLLRIEGVPRYRGRPEDVPEKPQEPEDFERTKPGDTDWIEVLLVDEQGQGIPGQRYLIITPDGQERRGFTDSLGSARVTRIPSGTCKVSFPDLDARAWKPGLPA